MEQEIKNGTYTIPEGFAAKIEDGKIIVEKQESEEENIRKEIIEYLTVTREKDLVGHPERQRWIAYLKKQKVKHSYDRMAPIYGDKESFESALDKAWKFYNESGSSTVDGCEDNAFELAFAKGFREGFLYKEKQKEQKTAEIDEYEIIKKHITEDSLSSEVNKRLTECGWYVTDEKPVEWSEEDKKRLESIIHRTEVICGGNACGEIKKDIDWLKFLRPQPHWRPSEEQIGALNSIILNGSFTYVGQTQDLISLKDDLKKL